MFEKFKAVFEKRNGEITVSYVHENSGSKTYLGTLDPTEDFDSFYEGEFVFNLAAGHLVHRERAAFLHIPINVLREIADYATAREELSDDARSKELREELENAEPLSPKKQ
jgi:hypothetical protein